MSIQLNHTVVAARDAHTSASWFAALFGVAAPEQFGPFWQITTANDVGLDFASVGADTEIGSQHYAFLISEGEFDEIYGRVLEWGLDHWADPRQRHPGEINHHDDGRGVYFLSNDGHYLEIITRPYGNGSA